MSEESGCHSSQKQSPHERAVGWRTSCSAGVGAVEGVVEVAELMLMNKELMTYSW